jgi:hypothetical protein
MPVVTEVTRQDYTSRQSRRTDDELARRARSIGTRAAKNPNRSPAIAAPAITTLMVKSCTPFFVMFWYLFVRFYERVRREKPRKCWFSVSLHSQKKPHSKPPRSHTRRNQWAPPRLKNPPDGSATPRTNLFNQTPLL